MLYNNIIGTYETFEAISRQLSMKIIEIFFICIYMIIMVKYTQMEGGLL